MKVAYTIATVAGYKHGSQLIITQQPQSLVLLLFYHNRTKLQNAQPFSFVCVHNKVFKLHLTTAKLLAEFLLQLCRSNTNPNQMHVKSNAELMFY